MQKEAYNSDQKKEGGMLGPIVRPGEGCSLGSLIQVGDEEAYRKRSDPRSHTAVLKKILF